MLEFLAPALAFGLAFFLTPCFKRLACRIGAMDQPNSRKIHRQAMPLLGGAAIYVSFWVSAGAVLYFFDGGSWFWGLFWGSSLIFALGLYDDLRGLSYKAKFAGQFAAALILLAYNIRIEFISLPYQEIIFLGIFIIPLTLLWVVGITNAVNLIDGIDGLATGVSVIAAVVIFALTWDEFHLVPVLASFWPEPRWVFAAQLFTGEYFSRRCRQPLSGLYAFRVCYYGTDQAGHLDHPGYSRACFWASHYRYFLCHVAAFQEQQANLSGGQRPHSPPAAECGAHNPPDGHGSLYLQHLFGAAAILFHYFSGIGSYLFLVIFALFLLGVKHLDNLRSILTAVNGSHYSGKAEKQHKDYNQGL